MNIIGTAETISNAAKSFVEVKSSKDVRIYATHAVCSGAAFGRLSSEYIKQVVFSDSIPLAHQSSNIRVVSVAEVLVNEMKSLKNC